MKIMICGSRECTQPMVEYAARCVERANQQGHLILTGDAHGIDHAVCQAAKYDEAIVYVWRLTMSDLHIQIDPEKGNVPQQLMDALRATANPPKTFILTEPLRLDKLVYRYMVGHIRWLSDLKLWAENGAIKVNGVIERNHKRVINPAELPIVIEIGQPTSFIHTLIRVLKEPRKPPTLEDAIEHEYRQPSGTPKRKRFGLNAFKRGWQDAANGNCSPDNNPYPDLRTDNGSVTFSRAYRRAWLRGYTAYHKMWREYDPGYHLP